MEPHDVSLKALIACFSSLLSQADPAAIPEFISWMDKIVLKYKLSKTLFEKGNLLIHRFLYSVFDLLNSLFALFTLRYNPRSIEARTFSPEKSKR